MTLDIVFLFGLSLNAQSDEVSVMQERRATGGIVCLAKVLISSVKQKNCSK